MDLELGKTSGAAAGRHRPLTWRSLMRRALWPTVSDRPAGRRWLLFGLLAALAAPGCGHEAKIEFTNVAKPPTRADDPAAGPEDRPGRRPAELHRGVRAHVDLSQADRLHREVERGHRRQGEEGRRARHPVRARAGRGLRDQEARPSCSTGSGSRWPRRWWRWPRPTSRRPRRGSRRPRRSWTSTRPRSSAGTREVKRLQREVNKGVVDSADPRASRPISSSRASRRGTRPRRRSRRRRPSCSPGGPRWPRPRSTSRSPRPT